MQTIDMIKETKGRSSEKTPFTIITKTASPKKKQFLTKKKILLYQATF